MQEPPTTVPRATGTQQAGEPNPKQARRLRWLWSEASIWTDRMLAALETQVKGGVWFRLIDKVYARGNLWSAWSKTAKNQGSPGVDGITIDRYEKDVEANLQRLSEQLRAGTYQPRCIRRTFIPKSDGTMRPLGIPTVSDRNVQSAVRYDDDFVILCRTKEQAESALEQLRQWTAQAGLTLHPQKTRLVDVKTEPFEFLGYRFDKGRRWPRSKSKAKLRDAIRVHTRRTSGVSLKATINRINPILRGWFGYFKHAPSGAMEDVDRWVRMRLRSILRKRQKRKGRGRGSDHQRWKNTFFAAQGLFSLKTARWRVCQSMKMAH